MIYRLKIPSGQRSRSPPLTKRIVASANEIAATHKQTKVFRSAELLNSGNSFKMAALNTRDFEPRGGGVLDISLDGEVRRGPSYPDPV